MQQAFYLTQQNYVARIHGPTAANKYNLSDNLRTLYYFQSQVPVPNVFLDHTQWHCDC